MVDFCQVMKYVVTIYVVMMTHKKNDVMVTARKFKFSTSHPLYSIPYKQKCVYTSNRVAPHYVIQ